MGSKASTVALWRHLLSVTASFCAGNGRLFATIGPCLSVGSNRLLWLAGGELAAKTSSILENCLLEESAIAMLHERSSAPPDTGAYPNLELLEIAAERLHPLLS